MKTFKVKAIVHSGAQGKRGAPRIEEQFTSWLGAIVEIDSNSVRGEHMVMYDALDTDRKRKYESDDNIELRVYKKKDFKSKLTVETETTVYIFEEF